MWLNETQSMRLASLGSVDDPLGRDAQNLRRAIVVVFVEESDVGTSGSGNDGGSAGGGDGGEDGGGEQ